MMMKHHHHRHGAMDDCSKLLLPPTPLHLLLLLLLLPRTAQAQQGGGSPPSPTYSFSTKFNPTVAVVVVLLISAFFFAGFLFVYCRQRTYQRRHSSGLPTAGRSRRAVEAAPRGLNPEVVNGFPTLVYADVKGHRLGGHADAPLECAVCLCEFADEDQLTLLPKCSHAFHPTCIAEWLGSHTTCPVCRANLAAEDEIVEAEETSQPSLSPTPAANNREESRHDADAVAIRVDEEAEEQQDEHPAELTRMGSSRKGPLPPPPRKSFRTWRSRSARPAIGERAGPFWAEEDRERFTLRLPEELRREVMAGKLNRSISVTAGAFPAGGARSSRKGYIGGDGSSRGGRSYRMVLGRWDRKAKSDRGWPILGRAVAAMGSRHGGAAGGEGDRTPPFHHGTNNHAPITKGVGEAAAAAAAAAGEGSSRGTHVLAAVRDQFNRLIRGGSKHQQPSDTKDDDEASTAAINKV